MVDDVVLLEFIVLITELIVIVRREGIIEYRKVLAAGSTKIDDAEDEVKVPAESWI